MNILVLAEKMDMAIKFACAIGGMKVDNKEIMLSNLDEGSTLAKCQNIARKNQHIKTQYNGNFYTFIWANGHCVTIKDAADIKPEYKSWYNLDHFFDMSLNINSGDYDFSGDNFKVIPGKEKIIAKISKEITSGAYDFIISATDFAREGEAIFKFIYNYIRTNSHKKVPVYKRAKIVEISEKAIREGFENLIDFHDMESKELAAYARAFSDKIIGANMTVALTLLANNPIKNKNGKNGVISCGRVQTPTLNMIIKRDDEIKNYVKKSKWRVEAEFEAPSGDKYKGLLLEPLEGESEEDEIDIKEALKSEYLEVDSKYEVEEFLPYIKDDMKDFSIRVLEVKQNKTSPPLLYDTNTLLVEADKKTKFNSEAVMAAMELLYQDGYISYPRTDSQYMNDNDKEKLHSVIFNLKNVRPEFENVLKQLGNIDAMPKIFNSKKVNDHYAIIPTNKALTSQKLINLNISSLKKLSPKLTDKEIYLDVWNIYIMICKRTFAVVMPEKITQSMTIITSDGLYNFKSQVSKIVRKGWSFLYNDEEEENTNLQVEKGDAVKVINFKENETFNKKPSYYTEGSLMAAMENCSKLIEDKKYKDILKDAKGIGTPATRVGIIKSLLDKGYVNKKGKHLEATENGRKVISLIPSDDLLSPILSAKWEAQLQNLENGKDEHGNIRPHNENLQVYKSFMNDVKENTKHWIKEVNPDVAKKMKIS